MAKFCGAIMGPLTKDKFKLAASEVMRELFPAIADPKGVNITPKLDSEGGVIVDIEMSLDTAKMIGLR
jgi:hypothetical protein